MSEREVAGAGEALPAKLRERREKQPKGRVIVYGKWCKECGICIAFCPRNVLAKASDGSVVVARPDDCTACLWCELHCPDFAITVKRIDE